MIDDQVDFFDSDALADSWMSAEEKKRIHELAERGFFCSITEHADGERRGPLSIRKVSKKKRRVSREPFPMPPSDPV